MPILVRLPNGGTAQFPDGTSEEEIRARLAALDQRSITENSNAIAQGARQVGRGGAGLMGSVGTALDVASPDRASDQVIADDSFVRNLPFGDTFANTVNRAAEVGNTAMSVGGNLVGRGLKALGAEQLGAGIQAGADTFDDDNARARADTNARRAAAGQRSLEEENQLQLGNVLGGMVGDASRATNEFFTSDETRANQTDFARAWDEGIVPGLEFTVSNPGTAADVVMPSLIESMAPAGLGGRAVKAGLMGMARSAADDAERLAIAAGKSELDVVADRTKALVAGTVRAEQAATNTALGVQAVQVTEMNTRQQVDAINLAPVEELRKNPEFVELEAQLGEAAARAQLAQRVFDGGVIAGLPLNAAGAFLPGKLGLQPVESALAGGAAATGRVAGMTGLMGRVARTGVKGAQEAAGEAIQGGVEQLASNIAGVPAGTAGSYLEGVGKNAVMEATVGFGAGGVAGMFTGPAAPAAARGEARADQFFRDAMPKFAPLAETGQTDPAVSMSTPPPAIPPRPVSRPTAPPAAVVPPSSTAGMPSLADVGLDLTNPVDPLEQQLAAAGAAPVLAPRVPQPAPTPTRQSVRYAPRNEGETDKEYAKRVVDKTAAPESLVDDPSLYFNPVEGAQTVPVNKLLSTKTAAENVEGGTNGAKRMAAAAAGVLGKRDPIDVMANPDGTFSVVDGNGTLTAAKAAGLTNLPVRVVGQQTVEEAAARAGVPAPAIPGFAGMYARAAAVSPKFDEAMRTIAESLGAKALLPGLKSIKRAADKVVGEYGGDPGRLKDLVRGTLEISTLDDAPATIETLQQQFGAENVTLKRNHLDPNASPFSSTGYRDALALVTVDGVTTEVQVSTPEMLAAKKAMHDKYVRQSEIERAVAARASESNDLETMPTMEALRALVRSSTVTERAERRALVREQRAAYTAAFAASTSRANSASSISESTSSSKNAVVQNTFLPPSKMNPPISPQAAGLPSMIPNRVSPAIAASSTGPETSVAQARVAGATRASTSGEAAPAVEVTDQLRAHARRLQVAVTAAEVVEGKGNKGAAKTRVFHTVQEALDAGFNVTPDQDGFYDIDTDTVGIIAANTTSADRALWIAWHEKSGHRGLIGTFGDSPALVAELKRAGTNPIVRAVAEALRAQRDAEARKQDPRAQPMSDSLAIEEALAELQAAVRTGNWREISKRYGVEASGIEKKSVADVLRRMLRAIRAAITGAGGKSSAYSNEDVMQLLEVAHQRGMGGAVSAEGDVRASKAKPAATAPEPAPSTRTPVAKALSSRVPTAKKATENAIDEVLAISYDQALKDSKTLEKNAKALAEVPNMAGVTGSAEEIVEKAITHMVGNLQYLHDLMPEDVRQRARLWYDGGRKYAELWADRYGISEMQAAAAIAVLSPQNDWYQNVTMAERVADAVFGQRDTQWSEEMTATADEIAKGPTGNDPLMAQARGKTLGELLDNPPVAARWIRAFDQSHNSRSFRVLTPEGGASDWMRTKSGAESTVAWKTYGALAKAVSVLTDGRMENVHAQLGNEHKVRNFYNNIAVPNSDLGFATIDTHAMAAAWLRPLAGSSTEVIQGFGGAGSASSSITGLSGTYALYLEAYRRAAEANGLLPREMQSIAWESVRGVFEAAQKQHIRQRADAIWARYANGEIDQSAAQAEILSLAGGFTQPNWTSEPFNSKPARTYEGDGAKQIDANPAPPEAASRVLFEVAPDPNDTELTGQWNGLSDDAKIEISADVAKAIVPKVMDALATHGEFTMQLGGYLGATNPSLTLRMDRPELLVSAAKMLGHALSQDSMMVVAPSRVIGAEKTGAVTIVLEDGEGAEQVTALYDKLWELEHEGQKLVGGHNTAGGEMVLLNFSPLDTPTFAKMVDDHLGGKRTVKYGDVYAAFPQKEDYGYASDQGTSGAGSPVQQRGNRLRSEASRLLAEGISKRSTRASTKRSRPDAAGDRRARGGDGGAAEEGGRGEGLGWNERPVQADAVAIVGVHYSRKAGLKALDGSKYGSNHQGAEWKRIQNALYQDEDRFAPIANRVYFYPKGTKLEAGESMVRSPNRHEIPLANLYDYEGDPGKLYYEADNDNEFELAVIEAGYDGYVTEDMAVVLGTKPIPTRASTKRASVEYGSSDWDALVEDALLESGQTIANSNAAMKLWSDGRHRIFAMHENAETVDEVTSIDMLRANTPDQLMALPSDVAAEYGITERPTRASTVNPVETARAEAAAQRETYSDLSKQLREAMAGTGRMELATARARRLIGEVAAIGDVDALLRDARRELAEAKRAIDDEGRDALPEYDRAMDAVATLQRTGKEARAKAAEANRLLDMLERAERTGTLAQRQLQLERLLDAVESSREAYEAAAKIRDWRRSRQRAIIKARQKRGDTLNKLAAEGMPQGNITWSVDAAARKGLLRVARRALQDKMIEVRDIGKAIAEAIGQELPDLLNLYQAENLMHGKAEEGIEAVQRTLVEPLKAAIKATGLSNAEIHKYLWARHAEERNKRIAEINPGMPDGGSGMSTARARQVLADFAAAGKMPQLEAVGRRVQAIRHHTLDTLLRSGQITPELHNRLSTMYQHYVPLRGDPKEEEGESRIGTGRGLDVRGNPFQRALGRNTEPRDILGELVGDAERAVLQGAKAEVGRTLLRMALQFPNKDVWEVEPVIVEPKFSEATGEVYLAVAQADQEQTVIVKHNGKPYAVRLVDPRLREAVLGYGVNGTEAIAKLLGWANRWLSAVSTRFNPAFVAVNMIRDMIQGSMAIGSELGAGALKESLILYGPAMKAMWQSGNGAGDSSVPDAQKTMVDWAREFAEAGGKTGYASVADPETVQQRIEFEMATIGQLLRDKHPVAAVSQALQRSTIVQGIERANDSAENALRLAVYVHMRKAGSTQPKAAQYAKNVTINFNRRGHLTGALNALYLFFNASMQGGHRTLQLLSDKRILATLGTVGAAQGALAITAGMMTFGDDDDETLWEQIPDYVREKAFVIPLGFSEEGDPQYAAIPMPFGFNLFTMVGGYPALVASDTWRSRQDKSWQATMLADVARSSIDAFSVMPLGEEGWFMPTLARMQQNFAANKDDLGNSIRSMAAQRGDAPRAYAGKADASDAARAVAIALNRLGGGDEVTKPVGWLDYAPEDIEYMIGQVTGGAGNSLQQLLRVSTRAVRGMDIAPGDIPVTGRLVGSQRRERVDQRMFYEASDRMDSGLDRLRLAFVDGGIDAFEQQKAELGPAFEGVVIARYKTTDRQGGYRRGDYRIDSDTGRPTFVAIPGSTFDYYKDAKRKSDDYSDIIKATYSSDVLSGEERAKQVEALQIERATKVRDFMRSWNQASKQ